MKRRLAQIVVSTWFIWAQLCGIGVCCLGAGVGLVQLISGDDAVIKVTDVRNVPIKVPYKGRYQYTYDMDRVEDCPGEVVIIFSSKQQPNPAVITMRKPALMTDVKSYTDLKVDNPLPESVTPGLWLVTSSLISSCANRTWTDKIAEFTIEVVANDLPRNPGN